MYSTHSYKFWHDGWQFFKLGVGISVISGVIILNLYENLEISDLLDGETFERKVLESFIYS